MAARASDSLRTDERIAVQAVVPEGQSDEPPPPPPGASVVVPPAVVPAVGGGVGPVTVGKPVPVPAVSVGAVGAVGEVNEVSGGSGPVEGAVGTVPGAVGAVTVGAVEPPPPSSSLDDGVRQRAHAAPQHDQRQGQQGDPLAARGAAAGASGVGEPHSRQYVWSGSSSAPQTSQRGGGGGASSSGGSPGSRSSSPSPGRGSSLTWPRRRHGAAPGPG